MRYYAMKRRSLEPEDSPDNAEDALCRAFLALGSVPQMRALLHDLSTPAELEALTDRWRVVPYLLDEVPYREIHDRTAVSITTIGRVARCLNSGSGGYLAVVASQRKTSARKPAARRGAKP